MKLSIIIPVYNEADTIEKVIKKIDSLDISPWEKEVIIVDDGSTDGTDAIITKCANGACYRYKIQDINRGKGAAICTGVAQATGDFVLIVDADEEYDLHDIPKLLGVALEKKADAVYGNRFHSEVKHKKSLNYFGNRGLTTITNILFFSDIKDMEVCYKLIRRELFNSLCLCETRFGFEPEVTCKLLKKKIKVHQVSISYHPRDIKAGKKIRTKDGFLAAWILLRERFTK